LIQINAVTRADIYELTTSRNRLIFTSLIRGRVVQNAPRLETLRLGIICGTAGGLAEIVWVTLYASLAGGNAAVLARGVTSASGIGALLPAAPVEIGVGVHLLLALALGVALAVAWDAMRYRVANPYPCMLAALTGIWVVNFFVVLPILSPAFVHLVPYAVSLASKLFFGAAAAETVRRFAPGLPKGAADTAPSFG
jgi:hypothetical protein